MRDVVKTIADEEHFLEVHQHFARNLVVGFIRLNGASIGPGAVVRNAWYEVDVTYWAILAMGAVSGVVGIWLVLEEVHA